LTIPNQLTNAARLVLIGAWALLFAAGPVALHSLVDCSHSQAADTVEHQESDHAHWAALRSIDLPDSECSICNTLTGYHFADQQIIIGFIAADTQQIILSDCLPFDSLDQLVSSPRAPPVS
jgi:hypothetical protein